MSSIHTFKLEAIKTQAVHNGGSRAKGNENNFSTEKDGAVFPAMRQWRYRGATLVFKCC